jgi:hypothetical protein
MFFQVEFEDKSMEGLKRGAVRADGMVLVRRKNGVEIWGTKEQLDTLKLTNQKYMEQRRTEYRKISKEKKWNIGDYNPQNGLYFIRRSGNLNCIWGTKDRLEKYREQRKLIRLKYVDNLKEKKIDVRESYGIKRRRGDIDPILNKIFWKYNSTSGKEMWLNRETYLKRLAVEKRTRNLLKLKRI